jgi:tetratricopeptide (TPR) repeat protein
MALTVCLLTRNDESRLGRALPSVAGIADELLVADAGSTDRTIEVARAFGARVLPVAWRDDFGQARNQALAEARGDWLLWLNPDEEFDRSTAAALHACVQEPEALAFDVRVWDYARPSATTYSETLEPRLFRNDRGIAFRGRLHPEFHPPLEEIARQRGARVQSADVRIRRFAYLSPPSEDKLRWAAGLLEQELRDRPGQVQVLIELGRTLLSLKEPRGHEVLAQAAAQIHRLASWPAAPAANVSALLEYLLTTSAAVHAPLPPAEVEDLAERWFPATPPVLWALALRAFRDQDFLRARDLLERLVDLGATGRYDRTAPFEPSLLGGLAWLNLGVCCAKLGQLDRAEQCFAKLLLLLGFEHQGRQYYAWVQQQKAAAGRYSTLSR